MVDRCSHQRSEGPDRRKFPRPPLWLNLLLLILALATFGYAQYNRTQLREKTARLFQPTPNSPAELNRIRAELSEMDLTREQIARELDGRMQYLQSLQGEQFYIAIDTNRKKLELRLGREVVRDADIQIGAAQAISGNGKTWTFAPLKGGFNVVGKEYGYAWRVPEWWYAMKKEPVPAERPYVKNGLGKYVIFLPDGYVIHSQPSEESPLQGAKPGSFLVPESDLAAIWPRISKQTRVYIF